MGNREQYKSLQIYRPVAETASLKNFLTRADNIGKAVFGSSGIVMMPRLLGAREDYDIEESDDMELTGVGISKHHIYDSENLKLTLLDRRAPVHMYSQMQRTYQKLAKGDYHSGGKLKGAVPKSGVSLIDWRKEMFQAGLAHDVTDSDDLSVVFDAVNFAINPDYDYKGREVSLFPSGKQPEKLLLDDESIICFRALKQINKDKTYPTDKKVLDVPFIRLQRDAEDKQMVDFLENVEKLLPITLQLGRPELSF